MKARKIPLILISMVVASFSTSVVWAKNEPPAINADGMALVKNTNKSTIYSDPDVDLGIYTSIMLEDASVAFKKNWRRNYNRNIRSLSSKVKDSDMQRIKDSVATAFKDAFSKELQAGGYQLVDEPGEFVLLVKPSIINLDVNAPDLRMASSRTRTFAESAGEMTLKLELYDSQTNDSIVIITDRKRDFGYGYLQWRTSGSNRADAKRMMNSWAKSFREGLDEARASVGK